MSNGYLPPGEANLMLSFIKKKFIRYFETPEFNGFTFNTAAHQKIISDIESKLFEIGDLQLGGMSTLSIMIRRSIGQFLGYKYWNSSTVDSLLRNTTSIVLIPGSITYYFLKRYLKRNPKGNSKRLAAVLISDISGDLHVHPFKNAYPDGSIVVKGNEWQLTWKDIIFIANLITCYYKIIFYPELVMRVIRRIAQYSFIVEEMNCATIVNMSAEGSPWSSILTAYCRMHNVEHTQIMHGIRLFSSQMAFAEFDKYFIWGELHFEEFKKMHVRANRFIIIGNSIHKQIHREISMDRCLRPHKKLLICFDYPIMTLDQMTFQISDVIKQFEKYEWEIGFRPHPRYTKEALSFLSELKDNITSEIDVDNPNEISLLNSIRNSGVILSCYSDALTDAWIAGKKCICIYSPRILLQEYHLSKNIKTFSAGDDLTDFILSPIAKDNEEWILKNRFSYNFDSSLEVDNYVTQ